MSQLSRKASVTNRGAVQLGRSIACDAFDETRPLRVITHAHADHMMGLRQSLETCEKILMTSATKDLIDVMKGPLFLMGGYAENLDYGKTLQYEDERITFFKADHILGAAQVLVEDAEGERIAYTGDFRIDDTPILEANVLVIEATYGNPNCNRSFGVDIKSILTSKVEQGLKHGPVYIFGYHGKLQEVMQILHSAGLKAPLIASEKVFQVSKACEKNGMRLGRLILSEQTEALELLKRQAPCVAFYHMNTRADVGLGSFRICISGWEFDCPVREIGEREYIVALSDHSDFEGLLEYVRRAKPTFVITENYRSGHAETLAKEIRRRLGISAIALPRR